MLTSHDKRGDTGKMTSFWLGERGVDTAIEAVGIPATFGLCQEIDAPGAAIATRLIYTVSTPLLFKVLAAGTRGSSSSSKRSAQSQPRRMTP